MEPRDVVVVGGSAGSMTPLRQLAAALPPGLPGAVAITIHISEHVRSQLPWLLDRLGPLPAAHAQMGEPLLLPGAELGKVVGSMLGEGGLVNWPRTERSAPAEVGMEETGDLRFLSQGETSLTRLACPECGGSLAEAVLPHITYYRCHVGHQFGPQSLAAAQAETAEAKLWAAVAALEETAALARHLATHAEESTDPADQPNGTVKWATDLAETVRARMRNTPDTGTSR